MTATHYIHIGRNKCASTTLQYFFLNTSKILQREGLDYLLFGHMADAYPLARSVRTPADYAKQTHNKRSTLISSEDLMGAMCRSHAAPMIEALNGAPRRVIAYIRDYNSWVRSTYMEAVMTGRTTLDFDSYLRQSEFAVSALNTLGLWAEHAGWENMYVRSLDPACLHKGDVLLDCAHAIGIDEAIVHQHSPEPKHVSPHWLCVEIIRALRASRTQSDWRTFTHEVIYPLRPLIEQAIVAEGADALRVQYMTPAQSDRLGALYNHDVLKLSWWMGLRIPDAAPTPSTGRPFLPSIDNVPRRVLRTLLSLADEAFKDSEPPAQVALRGAFRWARTRPKSERGAMEAKRPKAAKTGKKPTGKHYGRRLVAAGLAGQTDGDSVPEHSAPTPQTPDKGNRNPS